MPHPKSPKKTNKKDQRIGLSNSSIAYQKTHSQAHFINEKENPSRNRESITIESSNDPYVIAESANLNLGLINEEARELLLTNKILAKEKAQKAFLISKQKGDEIQLNHSLLTLAVLAFFNGETEHALIETEKIHLKAQKFASDLNDKSLLIRTTSTLIGFHYVLGNYTSALDLYSRNIEDLSNIESKKERANLLNNIAGVYGSLGEYENAIKVLTEVILLRKELADLNGLSSALINCGNTFFKKKQYEEALSFYNESLSLNQSTTNHRNLTATHHAIANVHFELGDYIRALTHYQSARDHSVVCDERVNGALVLQGMGKIYLTQAFSGFNIEQGIMLLKEAKELALSIQNKRAIFFILSELSHAYELKGDFENALYYLREYHSVKDEVLGEEQQKRTTALMILHKTVEAQKDAELERLKNIELAQAIKLADEANAFKTELLGIAAHDLKNPLQVILGFSQLISETSSIEEAKKHASMICSSSDRMLRLVRDLLETAAIDSGKLVLNRVPVSVTNLLRMVIERNRIQLKSKSLEVKFDFQGDIIAEIDNERMSEVFENLLSNAIKYSYSSKTIWITCKPITSIEKPAVLISIKDEGQGFKSEEKEKLFKKFQRLSSRPTAGESSTGLGLSIVKQLVALHNGSVWADSEGKDKGATFYITIPLFAEGTPSDQESHLNEEEPQSVEPPRFLDQPPRRSKRKSNIRVGVVEDIIEYRESLSTLIQSTSGFELVGHYGSVEEVVELMPEVDVVLMDIGLPGVSGIDAIQKVKHIYPRSQIIMLTVFTDDRHITKAILAGASGYLIKSTSHPLIIQAIEQSFQGGMPISPGVAKTISTIFKQYVPKENTETKLTKREKQILSLLIKGMTFNEISASLFISFSTVANHMRHVYEKLHVHSKSEVVAKAIREGIV